MNRPARNRFLLAVLLVWTASVLPACRVASARKVDPAVVEPASHELDGRRVTERWIPTGDPATGVLLLRQVMPSEMRVDRDSELVFELVNRTADTLPGVSLAVMSLDNLEFLGAEPSPTLRQGGQPIWMLGDLLPRESRTITIRARPSGSGAVTTVVAANFANLLTVSAEATEPRIDLVKTATPDACGSCTDIEWTYAVRNVGTGVARGVVIKDALPEGVRTPDGAREISFAAGDLPGGFTRTFTAILRAERAGSFASEATATDRGGQVVRTPAVGTSVEEPMLSLVAMPSRRATEGTDAEFRFEVANGGGCEVRGAVVRVEIPVGFVLVATTDGGVIEGKSVRWTLESVRPGESIERRITLRGKAPESTSITARLEAACLAERSTRTAVEIVAAPDVP